MSEINRVDLFGKLNEVGYKSIEAATNFCKIRGNPTVELAHWLQQILQLQDSDLHHIIDHFGLDHSKLAKQLTEYLAKLPRGARTISDFSQTIVQAIERGWVYATLLFKESQVRSGYLMVGMLKVPSLTHELHAIAGEFMKVKEGELSDDFAKIVDGSPEGGLSSTDQFELGGEAVPGEMSGSMPPAQMGKGEALARYAVDMTQAARDGKIDNIVGRDEEIRQIVDILMRRRQNNPILTGEAGVGKTAVVEGFALRIARGDVPPPLRDVSLHSLDIGALQAGASMKGEFENRLKSVIEEVQSSEKPIILFIDEAHNLVGAGGKQGSGDAANLLKPELARGTLRTVAATTWAEYKAHFEQDPALTRRFQVVSVDEPSEEKAVLMMRGIASSLENHHRIQVLDEALEASVKLSKRYIPARQLPDKSVSLLDTACARVAVALHAIPAELEDTIRRIEALEVELKIIEKEASVGIDIGNRQSDAYERLAVEKATKAELEERWKAEKELVDRILKVRAQLRGESSPVEGTGSDLEAAADETADAEGAADEGGEVDRDALLAELKELLPKLEEIQGDTPLMLPSVDANAIAAVVADWTGIPVGKMVKNEIESVLQLADTLNDRVIGQRHGLEMIAQRIQTNRAGMDNPSKPIGVFMLCGPSGVGKTETALALAESLYGDEDNTVTINMSEYQSEQTVSSLIGAAKGLVGNREGGVLTEAVRRKPYSVVLLDEFEKAHPDVHEMFFQVFDKGVLTDSNGNKIDFKNTIILLTSNVGTDL
ncbi:MAG: type VI secretion system ATPase TssH, partial [Planctomycetota bacterium]